MRLALALVAVAGVSGVAAAQPGGDPSAPPPEAPPVEAAKPAAAVEPRADAGWSLYHRSFAALAHGDRPVARSLVLQLGREQPTHAALAVLRADGFGPEALADEPEPGVIVERPSKGARAELALFQAFHGLMVGIDFDLMLQADSGAILIGIPLLTTVAGIAGSLAVGDITPGTRALANSGTAWGELETALVLGALPTGPTAAEIGGALLAGSVGGLVLGASLSRLDITEGQVALANSGGLWTGAATLLTLAVLDFHSNNAEHFCEAVIGSTAAGLIGGAYLAKVYPETTRSHTLVIDAGGLAGGIVGLAIGAIAANGISNDRVNAGLSLGGMLLGLGGATYLTRNWDAAPSVLDKIAAAGTPYIAPVDRGGGGIAGYAVAW